MKYRKGNQLLVITQDEGSESPRKLWDNLGTMVCFHNQYDLGDKTELNSEDFTSWEKLEDHIRKELGAVVVLPLYLYDHSGITMSTTREYPYNCPFDSMRVGFIYATREAIRQNFMAKRVSKRMLELTRQILVGEVETYDQWLRNDIYGFQLFELKVCDQGETHKEHKDSCWGFYGVNFKENGLFDHAGVNIAEWKEIGGGE